MQKLHFAITINAPREKVWHAMLDDATYPEWTKAFNEGSHFTGSWDKGSKITFLGPDPKTGKEGGMVGRIAENKPNEYLSIEYTGIVHDGVEDTESELARQWLPTYENYTFHEKDGSTELVVDMDSADDHVDMFNTMWPEALKLLKALAEK